MFIVFGKHKSSWSRSCSLGMCMTSAGNGIRSGITVEMSQLLLRERGKLMWVAKRKDLEESCSHIPLTQAVAQFAEAAGVTKCVYVD